MAEQKAIPYGLTSTKLKFRESRTNNSLYSKYRPWTIEEFYGPTRAVIETFGRTLHNKPERLMHAFLVHGAPGSGKTSMVLALSKMLNCKSPIRKDGMVHACNACESCRSIEMRAMNDEHGAVVYKNTSAMGKDTTIAVLREKLTRSATLDGKNTILLLEEAQEMTDKSLTALLAPVETLKQNQYIFLVTSNPARILKEDALASRLEDVKIRAWSSDQILELLKDIAAQEYMRGEIPLIPLSVLEKIAINCEENPRDAVTILDTKVIAGGIMDENGKYDEEQLNKVALSGMPDTKLINNFGTLIMQGKVTETLDVLYFDILRKVDINPFVYRVQMFMRDKFNSVRRTKTIPDEILLSLMRGVVIFSDRYYNHRSVDAKSALVLSTMEALEFTNKFRRDFQEHSKNK